MNMGVFSSAHAEVVMTRQFLLLLYRGAEEIFGAALYRHDRLIAICERNNAVGATYYAFQNSEQSTLSNDMGLAQLLDSPAADFGVVAQGDGFTFAGERLKRTQTLRLADADTPLPVAGEDSIRRCLLLWRSGCRLETTDKTLNFILSTGQTEYVMIFRKPFSDINCGASVSIPMEHGLYGGEQYFRIRNYLDNSEPWCGFFCKLGKIK